MFITLKFCVIRSRSLWPYFDAPVILPYILKTISWINVIIGILSLCDTLIDIITNVGHLDLYFMVQYVCLMSWMLVDVWTLLFGIMNQYDPTVDLKVYVGHCDLYFMLQWFYVTSWRQFDVLLSYFGIMCLYFIALWCCLISPTIGYLSVIFANNDTVWPKLWPQSKYKSVWPIFHYLVILFNIF